MSVGYCRIWCQQGESWHCNDTTETRQKSAKRERKCKHDWPGSGKTAQCSNSCKCIDYNSTHCSSQRLFFLTALTKKRGKAQRVARPACANATVYFLLTYRLAMLLPPSEWSQRILPYMESPPMQMSHKISGVTAPKFSKFVAVVNFS